MNINTEGSGLPGSKRIHWLASFPKSGNTWVRSMLSAYGSAHGIGDVRARYGDSTTYWTQAASPWPIHSMSIRDIMQVRATAIFHMMAQIAIDEVVKTHQAFVSIDGVPLFGKAWTNRVIYVVRDPRDIVASLQAHMGMETREEAIEMMGDPQMALTKLGKAPQLVLGWSTHVRTWLDDAEDALGEAPLLVRYRDLHADTAGQLRRIVGHLGLECDEDRIAHAVDATDFDRVQAREQTFPFPERSEAQVKADAPFFRRGEVGGYRDELTPEQVARVEADHGEMMERVGYELATTAGV